MQKSNVIFILILVPIALLAGGCMAVGQAFDLASVVAALTAAGTGAISVAALDRREWIRDKSREPFFAGTFRGGFGNPFNVSVRDKKPLSDVTSEVVVKALAAKGFNATSVTTDPTEDDAAVSAKLKATGTERSVMIGIDKWQADTMTNVGMHYLLSVVVMDAEGNVLASNTITGEEDGMDNLRGSVMNPPKYAKKAVPKAFGDQLERLLNHEDVVKALS